LRRLQAVGALKIFQSQGYAMSDAADAKFDRSDEEWKKELAPETFAVMRKHGTERAGTK
jgi:hypothetical protein